MPPVAGAHLQVSILTATSQLIASGTLGVTGVTTLSGGLSAVTSVGGSPAWTFQNTNAAAFGLRIQNNVDTNYAIGVLNAAGSAFGFQAYGNGRVNIGGILAMGTTVVTSAAAGDIVLANSKSLRGVNAAGTGTLPLVYVDGSNRTLLWTNAAELVIGDALTQTTVGAAGGASALPASPTGYLRIRIGASQLVIPYYAQA